jgi:hypothetical protein
VDRRPRGVTSRRLAGLGLLAATVAAAAVVAGCTTAPTPASPAAPTRQRASPAAARPATALADPACILPPVSGHSTIKDQEAADAAYARVDQVIKANHLVGYAGGYVNLAGRQANIYWVGPVPKPLRELPMGTDGGTVAYHPATYSYDQMWAVSNRIVDSGLMAVVPSGYLVSSVGPCLDGTGVRVEVASSAHGNTPPKSFPPTLVARIKALAGDVPVLVVGGYVGHAT